jgi:hypothetical protein
MDWNPSISITVYFSRTGRSKARRSPLIVSALRCRTLFKESAERPPSLPSSPHPYIIMASSVSLLKLHPTNTRFQGVTVTVTSHGPQFLQKRNSKEQKLDKEGKPIESPHPHKGRECGRVHYLIPAPNAVALRRSCEYLLPRLPLRLEQT